MLIGITGGSGCGKSVAAEAFKDLGAEIIDADKSAREITKKGGRALCEIEAVFGSEFIGSDGELLRKKLGSLVFSDKKMLDKLNNIVGKYIKEDIDEKIENSAAELVVLDAPLLLEYRLEERCDAVVAVTASREIRLERIVARDKISYEDAKNRINSQKKDEYYLEKADYIVYNNSTREEVQRQVKQIIDKIKEQK